jgi:hypothetical protein
VDTGLSGSDLPCHCPYCGQVGQHDQFWTKEQVEYAHSMAFRVITAAVQEDLKSFEVEITPKGAFGIGVSMKVQPGPLPPIRQYREKSLETEILCDTCGLVYAVYGVFAYCPDCGSHNSLLILARNLDLIDKQLDLAMHQEDSELQRHLIEDAFENCVSVFDAFARQAVAVRANKSKDPGKARTISFQNLDRAAERLSDLLGVNLKSGCSLDEWKFAATCFMRRHLIAHRAGVVDQNYIDRSTDRAAVLGRRIRIEQSEVRRLAAGVRSLGHHLVAQMQTLM